MSRNRKQKKTRPMNYCMFKMSISCLDKNIDKDDIHDKFAFLASKKIVETNDYINDRIRVFFVTKGFDVDCIIICKKSAMYIARKMANNFSNELFSSSMIEEKITDKKSIKKKMMRMAEGCDLAIMADDISSDTVDGESLKESPYLMCEIDI